MQRNVQNKISDKYCVRFGQVAVEMGFTTPQRLKDALNIQVDDDIARREHRLLGRVMFDNDWMTSEQIDAVLNSLLKQMRNESIQQETALDDAT